MNPKHSLLLGWFLFLGVVWYQYTVIVEFQNLYKVRHTDYCDLLGKYSDLSKSHAELDVNYIKLLKESISVMEERNKLLRDNLDQQIRINDLTKHLMQKEKYK